MTLPYLATAIVLLFYGSDCRLEVRSFYPRAPSDFALLIEQVKPVFYQLSPPTHRYGEHSRPRAPMLSSNKPSLKQSLRAS